MNILVIGNGFDLAHGLPTKYTDFLFFCKVINCIIEDNEIDRNIPKNDKYYTTWLNSCEELSFKKIKSINDYMYGVPYSNYNATERDKKIYNEILNNFIREYLLREDRDQKLVKDIMYLIFNNFWINYFLQCDMHGNENWIDFESEISDVVKHIDKKMRDENCNLYDRAEFKNNGRIDRFLGEKFCSVTYKKVRDKLEEDLNKLIRAFEIYLTEYVENIEIKLISPDIKEIVSCSCASPQRKGVIYGNILSFNYTNIYEKVYWNNIGYIETSGNYMDHIHGKADISNTIESNNMVLGIDEYLGRKKRDKYVEFIAFKKFYQRIHKGTGCKYKEWIDSIQKDVERKNTYIYDNKDYFNDSYHNLFFFGHSLDITDKDILRDLILNDNVHTTIFYHDKDAMGQQIANLVKVIGQEELIRRTGGKDKLIEFKLQKPMIERKEE